MSSSAPSFITASVAVIVALISYRQWRTADDRLRLDLYNRRLDLYLSLLALEDVLAGWSGIPAEKEILKNFKRASRESQFMFPPESEVSSLFKQYENTVINITAYDELKPYFESEDPHMDVRQLRLDAFNYALAVRFLLDARIAPLLDFHSSSDPLRSIQRFSAKSRRRKFLEFSATQGARGMARIRSEREGRKERPIE